MSAPASPEQTDSGGKKHRGIRLLIVAAGLAAIGFACLILAWPAPFASTSESKKTTVEPMKTTTVTEKKTSSPSNALVGSVFGVGVLLLLAAVWFNRLQELKGPGGIGIVLAPPSDEEKRKIVELVPEVLRAKTGREPSPEEAALVTADALAAAGLEHARSYVPTVASELDAVKFSERRPIVLPPGSGQSFGLSDEYLRQLVTDMVDREQRDRDDASEDSG